VAALIVSGGRLLITQRREGDFLAGRWEFPGGKVEPGETPEEALRREIREELELEVEVGPLFQVVRHDYGHLRIRMLVYWCRVNGGVPRPRGCRAFRWVRKEELVLCDFADADRPVAERLAREEWPAGWTKPRR